MTRTEILYLAPYLASFLITLSILGAVFKKAVAPGSFAFGWYVLGLLLWVGGFIFEVLSTELGDMIFWDGFQWLGIQISVIAMPVFAVQFTEHKLRQPRILFLLSMIVPFLFSVIVVTSPFHNWVYLNPRITVEKPFAEMVYDFTPIVYGYAFYVYAVCAWGLSILIRRLIRPHGFYRAQIVVIILGCLIPIIGSLSPLMGMYAAPQRDATPFAIAIGSMILAWGLFRFRIFEVTPIARERIFESMMDPVVILDNQNLVVDINIAMLALLDKQASMVIGQPAKLVFDNFPIPIKSYTQVSYARTEAIFNLQGKEIHYELTIWPLYGSGREMIGRIYISHDITAMKELETELRKLNTELEDRVNARTQELAESYEFMLEGFARALELRDKETEGHSRRVTEMSLKIAQTLGVNDKDLENIRSGAILHDIGKISIPDEILRKPGKLTAEERKIVEQHPETAYKLLSPIPFLKKALEIPYCHHEKWDGTGYPQGLKGDEIPLAARIFAVADVWDALSNDRPYNKAWSREKIIGYFQQESGKHFDPLIVKTFLSMVEKGEI